MNFNLNVSQKSNLEQYLVLNGKTFDSEGFSTLILTSSWRSLKVRKYQKQFFLPSILPKNKRNVLPNSALG
jgi:hypothetical protein